MGGELGWFGRAGASLVAIALYLYYTQQGHLPNVLQGVMVGPLLLFNQSTGARSIKKASCCDDCAQKEGGE